MSNWIEPPPKEKKMGCLGKGCLLLIAFVVLLAIAFVVGLYVGTKPKELPQVQIPEEEQNAVRARWDEFEATARNEQIVSPATPEPAPAATAAPAAEPTQPAPTPPGNRIELTASDINALIARGRNTRGKAFVSIDNNVARVHVTVPLDKWGFRGRALNGEFSVRPPPDGVPHNLQISQMSFFGVPDGMLNTVLGPHSIPGYVDEFAGKYGITSFTIENNRVILETNTRLR